MDENEDIASALNSLRNKIDDLDIRVGQVLVKQLQTKKELDSIREKPESIEEDELKEKVEVEFPEDYHFTENLQSIFVNLEASQKAWLESIHTSKDQQTGLKGQRIFQEMKKHLSDRFEYLEMSKNLIQGPLLEDPPPPPVEEPIEEEPKEEKASKGKGGKKKDSQKKKK